MSAPIDRPCRRPASARDRRARRSAPSRSVFDSSGCIRRMRARSCARCCRRRARQRDLLAPDGTLLGSSNSSRRGLFAGRVDGRGAVPACASTGTARRRKSRIRIRSVRFSATSRSSRLAGGDPYAVLECLGAASDGIPTACRVCASPCGRRMRDASRWSATSMRGTAAVIRCGCGIRPACGNCSCRASAPGTRYKYETARRATAIRCR